MMDTRKDPRRLIWGIVLVGLGLLFLSANFGYGTWFAWDRWWPVVLIILGVALLYRRNEGTAPDQSDAAPSSAPPTQMSSRPRYPTGALVLIGIGAAFLLDEFLGGNAFPAFVLIAIGVALLLRSRTAS